MVREDKVTDILLHGHFRVMRSDWTIYSSEVTFGSTVSGHSHDKSTWMEIFSVPYVCVLCKKKKVPDNIC